jgi:hypothetical protein
LAVKSTFAQSDRIGDQSPGNTNTGVTRRTSSGAGTVTDEGVPDTRPVKYSVPSTKLIAIPLTDDDGGNFVDVCRVFRSLVLTPGGIDFAPRVKTVKESKSYLIRVTHFQS